MPTTTRGTSADVPTAPGRLPVLGHAISLTRRPLDFVTSLREHGDVVRIMLGPVPVYFVTDARLVHRLLTVDSARYTRGRVFDKARRFFGDSVAIVSGTEHRARRRLLQPVFAATRMPTYLDIMNRTVADRVASWRPGERIAVEEETHELAAGLLARPLFDASLDDADVAEICHSANTVMRGAYIRTVLPSVFEKLPLPANREFNRAVGRLSSIIGRIMETSRAHDGDDSGLLSLLLQSGSMTERQIYDEFVTILVGGLGNTAAAIAWTLYDLARHPEAEARARSEVHAVVQGKPIGMAELAALKFTGRCVAEAVRPRGVWILIRRTLEPVELGGVRLPAGAEVMYSITALHRDPRFFPDPTAFDPDRNLPDEAGVLSRQVYLPFGAGAHKCIGEHFGNTAAVLAVATILGKCRLRLVPGRPTREIVDASVRPDRLLMTVERP
jgi:cytochrome P450